MSNGSHRLEVIGRATEAGTRRTARGLALAALACASLLVFCGGALAGDITGLCAARTAIERVYHEHRTGTKPPFGQVMPAALVEKLVRADLKKEAALGRVYGVKITAEMTDAEVRRINSTTRAPEILAEIKAALANDPAKFAGIFAKPIVVERTLRARFENDDALHAPQRRIMESLRAKLLADRNGNSATRLALLKDCKDGELQEDVTWEMTPRPAAETPAATAPPGGPTRATASGGVYTNESTAEVARSLTPPATEPAGAERKSYFEDMPQDLQNVLRAQLRQPGDCSAVIESPGAFQLYLATQHTAETLSAAVLTIRKRSYESWLAEQPEP